MAVTCTLSRGPVGGGKLCHEVMEREGAMVGPHLVKSEEVFKWDVPLERGKRKG